MHVKYHGCKFSNKSFYSFACSFLSPNLFSTILTSELEWLWVLGTSLVRFISNDMSMHKHNCSLPLSKSVFVALLSTVSCYGCSQSCF